MPIFKRLLPSGALKFFLLKVHVSVLCRGFCARVFLVVWCVVHVWVVWTQEAILRNLGDFESVPYAVSKISFSFFILFTCDLNFKELMHAIFFPLTFKAFAQIYYHFSIFYYLYNYIYYIHYVNKKYENNFLYLNFFY